jgi:poly(3-hydroxybutyrate) depolymerase
MSEEQESTGGSLKKTILGTIATVVTAGGAWLASTLFGGGDDKPQPVQAAPVINIQNTQTQTAPAGGGGKTVILKEKVVEKPAKPKKEADEFKEKPAAW